MGRVGGSHARPVRTSRPGDVACGARRGRPRQRGAVDRADEPAQRPRVRLHVSGPQVGVAAVRPGRCRHRRGGTRRPRRRGPRRTGLSGGPCGVLPPRPRRCGPHPGGRVRRGGVPPSHLPSRRSAAAHPRPGRQPRPSHRRRRLADTGRAQPVSARQDRRLPVPGAPARRARSPPRCPLGAGGQRLRRPRRRPRHGDHRVLPAAQRHPRPHGGTRGVLSESRAGRHPRHPHHQAADGGAGRTRGGVVHARRSARVRPRGGRSPHRSCHPHLGPPPERGRRAEVDRAAAAGRQGVDRTRLDVHPPGRDPRLVRPAARRCRHR